MREADIENQYNMRIQNNNCKWGSEKINKMTLKLLAIYYIDNYHLTKFKGKEKKMILDSVIQLIYVNSNSNYD